MTSTVAHANSESERTMLLARLAGPISPAQGILLALFALLGIGAIVLIPYGAGFDEEHHFRRAWEMAHFEFVPNDKLGSDLPLPAFLTEASYREQPIVRPLEQDYWQRYGWAQLDSFGWIYDEVETRSFYSPVLLLPQSLALRYAGLKFQLPALHVIWSARLAGLLSYVLLVYLALRVIPFGRWILLVFALTPTALFQAATVTADTLTNGFGLLFIAGTLALAGKEKLDQWGVVALLGLCLLLFNGKLNLMPLALLPVLLLRPHQVGGRRNYALLVAAVVGLLGVFAGGWYLVTYPQSTLAIGESGLLEQAAFVSSNPLRYLGGVLSDLILLAPAALQSAVAAFGFYYWEVPFLVYPLFGLALIGAVLLDSQELKAGVRARAHLLIVASAVYIFTGVGLQWIVEPAGTVSINELHGRYLTAVLPLPVLALLGPFRWRRFQGIDWLPTVTGLASVALFVAGIGLVYHVNCGASYLNPGYCYQPQYKNWAPDSHLSTPVTAQRRVRQSFVAECPRVVRVRIWVNSSDADPGGVTVLQIQPMSGSSALNTLSVANPELPASGWLELDMPGATVVQGEHYWIELRHQGKAAATGPRLGMTQRAEYQRGQLTLGEETSQRDLFFQYGCELGIQRGLNGLFR